MGKWLKSCTSGATYNLSSIYEIRWKENTSTVAPARFELQIEGASINEIIFRCDTEREKDFVDKLIEDFISSTDKQFLKVAKSYS